MLPELTNERTILAMLRSGDEKAFRQVYNIHYRKIYLFAYSFLKNNEKSEDVLQETFLKFWIMRGSLDIELPAESLLFTICRNLVMDAFRKTIRTEKQRLHLLGMMNGEKDSHTEEKILFSDLMRVTETAIAELPKQQQAVIRLNKLEGMSCDEISTRLNISKNTVKNHLVVALKALRVKLDAQEIYYVLFLVHCLKIYFDNN